MIALLKELTVSLYLIAPRSINAHLVLDEQPLSIGWLPANFAPFRLADIDTIARIQFDLSFNDERGFDFAGPNLFE